MEIASLDRISRRFFPGYRAQIDRRHLAVFSERSLIPLIDVPRNARSSHPYYRPDGSFYGSALAIISAAVCLISAFFASETCKRVTSV